MTPKYLAWRKLFSHAPHIMDFVVVSFSSVNLYFMFDSWSPDAASKRIEGKVPLPIQLQWIETYQLC